MLPEQHDILFSFIAILFAVFGVFVFGNVVQACREREGLNSKLWGGIFVAMPTAIPVAPLTSKLGIREGSTTGSDFDPSYVGRKGTVCWSIS